MIIYTPRPGSKTEAAVAYLRANGGAATAIALSEAIDTERKNLPAQSDAAQAPAAGATATPADTAKPARKSTAKKAKATADPAPALPANEPAAPVKTPDLDLRAAWPFPFPVKAPAA